MIALKIEKKSSYKRTRSELSFVTGQPEPIQIPTLAALRAFESDMLSPVIRIRPDAYLMPATNKNLS